MLGHRCVATLSGVLCSLLVLATYACADATSASRPEYRTAIRLRLANLKQNVQRHQQLLAALSLKQQPDMEEAEENNGAASNPHGELSVLLKRLEELEQKLSQMQNDIADIQGWIEGQTESLMVMANDITDMKRFRASNYVQFQYRDSNEPGSTDAFAMRRFRISQTNTVDPRTSIRLSFDVATGTDTLQAQMRDAQLIYDIEPSDVKVGLQLLLGQQALPLGYELERSSAEREFPERAYYNRTMFNGERGRGLYLRYGTSINSLVHAGVWNALTFNDPEQRGRAPGTGNRLAVTAGWRYYTTQYDLGVSALIGKRPAFTAGNQTSPEVDRRFVFVDGSYIGLIVPQLFARGEVMFGKDRVPSTTANPKRVAKDMLGWHAVLGYNISSRNQLVLRYEQFDPDRDANGNAIHGYGVAYVYYINPGARVTAAYEVLFDPARTPNRSHSTTIRFQLRM